MKPKHYFFFTLIYCCISCNNNPGKTDREYYVISKQDSITAKSLIPPPPPPTTALKFYADLVFILANNNKVYIYQTEKKFKYDNDASHDYEFPNFIDLKPEYLITINSKGFLQFLKDNNDIFRFGANDNPKLFYIASETDTIKNTAFFDIMDFISSSKHDRIIHLIRRTTEEENNVLACKKREAEYLPQKINWSQQFLNGKFKPLTKEYDHSESGMRVLRKAKPIFNKNINEVLLTL